MITVDMSQMRPNAIEKASVQVPPAGEIKALITQLDNAVTSLEVHCGDLVSQLTPVVFIVENEAKLPSSGAPAARTQLGTALAHLVSRVEELRGKIAKVSAGLEL